MFFASIIALGMVATLFWVGIANVAGNQGGADLYGYRWTDSNLPPPFIAFSWIEISGSGTYTGVTGDDSCGGPYPIGFGFEFYGNTYYDFWASTNGLVDFSGYDSDYWNEPIPTGYGAADNFATPYWDDLYVSSLPNGIFYQTVVIGNTSALVVEWFQVTRLGMSELMTFEVILYETGEIWFQYNTLNGMTGDAATVGIENYDGSDGCQYSYNTATLSDNLAIEFSLSDLSIGPNQQQMASPGATVYYLLTVSNYQDFPDSFDIYYTSVLGWSVMLYDTLLNPLGDNNGNGLPDTGDILPDDSMDIVVTVDIPASPSGAEEVTNVFAQSYADPALFDIAELRTRVTPVDFSPPHSDQGLDTNNNSLYDYLVVDASVLVTVAGDYILNAQLYDGSWIWITSDDNFTYLDTGLQTVRMFLAGNRISNCGSDGPYYAQLSLYDTGWNWLDGDTHTTQAYTRDEFDPSTGFSPPHSDQGLDMNNNSFYDYLVVDASVLVTAPGNYILFANLYDSSWNWITSDDNFTYLDAGLQTVRMFLPGNSIFNWGSDGPYNAQLTLLDSGWNWLDDETHTTQVYTRDEFEPSIGFFPPHSDQGLDIDGDGLYDYLVVDIVVYIATPGDYIIGADLLDSWWNYVDSRQNYTYLDTGFQTVQFIFEGNWLWTYGFNGSYYVVLNLWDTWWNWLDGEVHTTQPYSFDEFDPPTVFSPPHSDHGLDTDSDGLYDYLVVEAVVNVSTQGNFSVDGNLMDNFGNWLAYAGNSTYLESGLQVITLMFDGRAINGVGTDGPYTVFMDLYDGMSGWLDSDMYATDAYQSTDFELPRAYVLFDQTHSTDPSGWFSVWIRDLKSRGYAVDTLGLSPITQAALESYDVLVVPQAHSSYSWSELAVIEEFVLDGGGLAVIGDDSPSVHSDLTSFAGITWDWGGWSGYTGDITPHAVTEGVATAYFGNPSSILHVAGPAEGIIRDPGGNIMVAASMVGMGSVVGVTDRDSLVDWSIWAGDNLRLANNIIDWLAMDRPVVSLAWSPMDPVVGETITFDASASYDPDGTIDNYSWNFGDGTQGSEAVTTHMYSAGGTYVVSLTAFDNDGMSTTVTTEVVVSRIALGVQVQVGTIHFRGEMAEFYILVSSMGEAVDADVSAELYYNGLPYESLSASVEDVGLGLYRIPYTIPLNASTGTYALVVEADYLTLEGVSMESFLLSPTLTGWDALLVSINGTVGTIKTDVGLIEIDLDAINATLVSIEGELVTIGSDIGVIQADVSDIDASIAAINGTLATVQTNLGQISVDVSDIDASITAINGTLVTIDTTLGSIQQDIGTINGEITSIGGTLATVQTDLGTISVDVTDINARLASLDNTVATIQTSVGAITTDIDNIQLRVTAINGTCAVIQTTLGTLEGRIISIEGDIATIQTDIGVVKDDVSDVKGDQPAIASLQYGSLILVIAALVIGAVILVMLVRRKPS